MTSDPSDRHPRARRCSSRARVRALGRLVAGALAALMVAPASIAQPEQNVKAAFVFNFVRFTEWPAPRFAGRDSPLALCVWSGDARLSDSMKALAGRAVDERSVRVSDVERPDDLTKCHALFIADATPRGAAPAWLRKAETLDVLTMGDGDGFAAAGGMIGLVSDGSRMRFEINDAAVKRSRLKLGAQLYQLGRSVAEGEGR
jgi:YfiR/HmsC-like